MVLRQKREKDADEERQAEMATLAWELAEWMRPELYDPLNPADTAFERRTAEERARQFLEASCARLAVSEMQAAARDAADPERGPRAPLSRAGMSRWLRQRVWEIG